MRNPYRKLFNLFAISLLAFAVYLNFFRTESNPLPERSAIPYRNVSISAPQKSLIAVDGNKVSMAKPEKKN
jgi:hypothetical protein